MPIIGGQETAVFVTLAVLILRWFMSAWLMRPVATGSAAAKERP